MLVKAQVHPDMFVQLAAVMSAVIVVMMSERRAITTGMAIQAHQSAIILQILADIVRTPLPGDSQCYVDDVDLTCWATAALADSPFRTLEHTN